MRRISFSATLPQFLDGSKDVTRRAGWSSARAGDRLLAVNKTMGFKKGERAVALGVIELVSVEAERPAELIARPDYGRSECRREGFPDLSPGEFVRLLCKITGRPVDQPVNRIVFRRVPVAKLSEEERAQVERALAPHGEDLSSARPFDDVLTTIEALGL